MDRDCIDLGLKNIWQSWLNYRKGKKFSRKLLQFQYNLESEILRLHTDLNTGKYKHGSYRKFVICDNKRREISVAPIRDRIVHRLFYDYLVQIYDKTFIYDAWSCRKGKGLTGAINRTQQFLKSFPQLYIWQADIEKFFDNVDQEILQNLLKRRIKDSGTIRLVTEVISSFSRKNPNTGMPIGNLTSQIFANIYLNELDRFIKHIMKPLHYLRYGDDFIVLDQTPEKLQVIQKETIEFLRKNLSLKVNDKKNLIRKVKHGLEFLGVVVYPDGRKLNTRNLQRIHQKLNLNNISSYYGLVKQHASYRKQKELEWLLLDKLEI